MIRSIRLCNAGPFRGEHVLNLGPKAYAVTARHEANAKRSNWSGKSFLMEMVNYGLTGHLPKERRDQRGGIDCWISDGERDAEVLLELEGGVSIKRTKRRGKSAEVFFTAHGNTAIQGAAEAAMFKHLCFGADDFRNVAYFEQGEIKRFVRTEPEKRFDIVRGWLGIEKAKEAEAAVSRAATAVVKELRHARGQRDAVQAMLDAVGEIPNVATLVALRDEVKGQMERAEASFTHAAKHAEHQRTVTKFDVLIENGKKLAEIIAAMPTDTAESAAAKALRVVGDKVATYTELDRDVARRKKIVLGMFDGQCPVVPNFVCPAKTQINKGDPEVARKALDEAKVARDAAKVEWERAEVDHRAADATASTLRARERELARIRTEATALQPEVKAARKALKNDPPPTATAFDMAGTRRILSEAQDAIAGAESKKAHKAKLEQQLKTIDTRIARLVEDVADQVAGRNVLRAAQRRIIEQALDKIGATSGAMLQTAGIDLSVEIRWEREGKNPAKACDVCGDAFPASAKVKECAGCGAERGMNQIQRLDFIVSDRSGAADDLAGAMLQLSAGAWLLHARSSPWATAMLDEPLAACDEANRRALAMQLIRLLNTGTWRQSLVISHSRDIVDLYPGRIEVVVARDGSRRIVQTE